MKRPQIGDEAWQVDWCSHMPITEWGDADIDGATYERQIVRTKDAAMRIARSAKSADGVASIMPVRFEPYDDDDAIRWPHVGFWEPIGDPEYIDSMEREVAG